MSVTTGVTAQGFVAKQTQDILKDMNTACQNNIDAQIDTSPEAPLGQWNGIAAEQLAQLWELGSVAYNSISRDNTEGPQLDNTGGLTGTKRLTPKPSYTLQTCVFSLAGTFLAGALVANVSGQPSVQFANGDDLSVQLVSGSTYECLDTDTNVVLATGPLPLTVPGIKFFCTVNGPTFAPAGQLTQITTPATGWTSTTNPLDAVLGNLIEQDTPYRLRQENEISASGSGNTDAIRADVLQVPGVQQSFVLENQTDFFDANGNPPHSFTVVIFDGLTPTASNDAVAQAIWNDKPTGIATNGSTTGNATDSQGNVHVIPFDRAIQQTLYLVYTITMLPGQPALNSTTATAMKIAIVEATQNPLIDVSAPNPAFLGLGVEVFAEAMKSALMQAGLGVQNVSALTLGFSASPVGTADLPVNTLSIAVADTSRILINSL